MTSWAGGKEHKKETEGRLALIEGKLKKGVYLVHSIRDDGGQSDSICPLKAFSVGATYFPFTVRSSSLRLGCWKKHKPVTHPELPGGALDHFPAMSPLRALRCPSTGLHLFLKLKNRKTHEGFSSPDTRTGSLPYPETQSICVLQCLGRDKTLSTWTPGLGPSTWLAHLKCSFQNFTITFRHWPQHRGGLFPDLAVLRLRFSNSG